MSTKGLSQFGSHFLFIKQRNKTQSHTTYSIRRILQRNRVDSRTHNIRALFSEKFLHSGSSSLPQLKKIKTRALSQGIFSLPLQSSTSMKTRESFKICCCTLLPAQRISYPASCHDCRFIDSSIWSDVPQNFPAKDQCKYELSSISQTGCVTIVYSLQISDAGRILNYHWVKSLW